MHRDYSTGYIFKMYYGWAFKIFHRINIIRTYLLNIVFVLGLEREITAGLKLATNGCVLLERNIESKLIHVFVC